jgi:putative ABC transport system permease protein
MSLPGRFQDLLGRVFRRPSDTDVDEEIRAHLQVEIDENVGAGMSPEEATYVARRKFGNVALFKEMTGEVWRFGWLDRLCQDVRIAARTLVKNRAFTFAALLTLALGIGSTTAIFSVVHAVLYPEYTFANPERIVEVGVASGKYSVAPSLVSFVDWRQQCDAFQELTAYQNTSTAWIDEGEPERIVGIKATANIFRMAGVQPVLGRNFADDADRPGRGNEVILGYGFWQKRYAGAASVIGKNVSINNKPCTVIGVMAAGKGFPTANVNFWIPWVIDEDPFRLSTMPGRGTTAARLRTGVSLAQAQAIVNVLEARLGQSDRNRKDREVRLRAAVDHASPLGESTVWTLFGAVLFVLLVSCVNVANLLLARASVRARETALRAALGASRMRIVRYLLTECVLLSFLGGVAGVVLAYWGVRLFLALKAPGIPGPAAAPLDSPILLFAIGTSAITAILFGLLPSFHASKTDLVTALRQGTVSFARRTANKKRAALVIIEMALALILLAGAGLMMNSFVRLQNVELGFNPENVIALRVMVPNLGSSEARDLERVAFTDNLLQRLRNLPQVRAAAATSIFPLDGSAYFTSAGKLEPSTGKKSFLNVEPVGVTEDYFRAMGIPLLRGRAFTRQDGSLVHPVTILSQNLAQQFWPDENPLGKQLYFQGDKMPYEVVGVAGNARYKSLQADYGPKIYVPAGATWVMSTVTFVVRTAGDPSRITSSLKQAVWAIDAKRPVEIETLHNLFEPWIATPRFYLGLFSFFALVAVLMAAIGLYGLVNYSVGQRTQEFGIRMALGAQPRDLICTVVREGTLIALAGAALGIGGALWLTRFIKSFLFAVTPTDTVTLAAVSAVLIAVAVLACVIPARRASRIEPSIALKYE